MYIDETGMIPQKILRKIPKVIKAIFSGLASIAKYANKVLAPLAASQNNQIGVQISNLMINNAKLASKYGKIAKGIGIAAVVIDSGLSIYNNFTNPNLSLDRKITDSIIDVGTSVGVYFAAAAIGAKTGAILGSFFPGVGNIIGAGIGAGAGLLIHAIMESSVGTWIKEEFNTIVMDVVDLISNTWVDFWKFEWI